MRFLPYASRVQAWRAARYVAHFAAAKRNKARHGASLGWPWRVPPCPVDRQATGQATSPPAVCIADMQCLPATCATTSCAHSGGRSGWAGSGPGGTPASAARPSAPPGRASRGAAGWARWCCRAEQGRDGAARARRGGSTKNVLARLRTQRVCVCGAGGGGVCGGGGGGPSKLRLSGPQRAAPLQETRW